MPLEELGLIPPNVAVEAFVPQSEVMPYAHAVVCHGGSGSLIGALAQGIPTVVVPLFADQPHNAASVARAGAGVSVTDRTAPVLREAIARVLKDEDIRRTAHRMAATSLECPPWKQAVERMACAGGRRCQNCTLADCAEEAIRGALPYKR